MDLLMHLHTFTVVARQRSFTRAAAELGVPQPVVSRRVATLERHLGARLLVRDPRGVVANEVGRAVLPLAEDLASRSEHLLEVARTSESGLAAIVPPGVTPRLLARVRAVAAESGVSLVVAEAERPDRTAAVAGTTACAALVACARDEADLVAPLGAATRTAGPAIGARRLHLDSLRRPRTHRSQRPRRVHVGPEDDVPWVRDVVRRRADRAGLAPDQVVVGLPVLSAAADVVAHDDVLLCTAAEARRLELGWQECAGLEVVRGYRWATSRAARGVVPPELRDELLAALATALGCTLPRGGS